MTNCGENEHSRDPVASAGNDPFRPLGELFHWQAYFGANHARCRGVLDSHYAAEGGHRRREFRSGARSEPEGQSGNAVTG